MIDADVVAACESKIASVFNECHIREALANALRGSIRGSIIYDDHLITRVIQRPKRLQTSERIVHLSPIEHHDGDAWKPRRAVACDG